MHASFLRAKSKDFRILCVFFHFIFRSSFSRSLLEYKRNTERILEFHDQSVLLFLRYLLLSSLFLDESFLSYKLRVCFQDEFISYEE